MRELTEIQNSFTETLKGPEIQNIGINISEVTLDAILYEGLLKDIPIIGTLVGIGKTSQSIRNSLFLKKIIHFLSELESIPTEKRVEMINSIDNDVRRKIKVGEKLIYILEKSDDYVSAQYIGQLFSAFLQNKIDYNEFLRCSRIVQHILIEDLEYFLDNDMKNFEGENAVSQDGPYDYINPLINAEICSFNLTPVEIEDQWDHEAENKYIVYGGKLEVSVTNIGNTLKNTLRLIK